MCLERTCENCLIKLRSKFKGAFEERHNLLSCWQHLPVWQKALSTNVPFLSCYVIPQPWQSPQCPTEGPGRELCGPRMLLLTPLPEGLAQQQETGGSNLWKPCLLPLKAHIWGRVYQCIVRNPCDFCHSLLVHQLQLLNFWASKLCICFKHLENFHAFSTTPSKCFFSVRSLLTYLQKEKRVCPEAEFSWQTLPPLLGPR